jgi:dTDP-4-dehydrorhamnose reductase
MIYLLGGSGYIGQAYQKYFKEQGISFRNIRRVELDYSRPSILKEALMCDKPEFLINAAGYTGKPNVDACESNKSECLYGNAILPSRIAEACIAAGVPWGHISSGCIYSGSRSDGGGFCELDTPNFSFRQNNCSFYSGTKALAEELLMGTPNLYIWRLRIPFNNFNGPRNYLSKIMQYDRLLDAKNSISQLQEFVAATVNCWVLRVPFGIYNVTNPGCITTRELVDHIQHSSVVKKKYAFFGSEEEFMSVAAKAPRSNCVLSSEKLSSVGIKMTDVHEAVVRDLQRWQW